MKDSPYSPRRPDPSSTTAGHVSACAMMWLLSSLFHSPSVLSLSFCFCSHLPQSLNYMPLIHAWRSHSCEWENKTSAPRHLAPSRVSLWVCGALGEIMKMGLIGVKVVKTMKYPQMHCSVMIHASLFKNKHKKNYIAQCKQRKCDLLPLEATIYLAEPSWEIKMYFCWCNLL